MSLCFLEVARRKGGKSQVSSVVCPHRSALFSGQPRRARPAGAGAAFAGVFVGVRYQSELVFVTRCPAWLLRLMGGHPRCDGSRRCEGGGEAAKDWGVGTAQAFWSQPMSFV